jgi:hypothetical protein
MMLRAERSLLRLVRRQDAYRCESADDFRNLNNVLGEITNLIWGAAENKYISIRKNASRLPQVPLVINHLRRYISFS